MDFEKIRAFYMVGKTGSVTKAAALLKNSISNISRHISHLETTMKVNLFDRGGRNWTLTFQGQFLFRKAKIILSEIEAIKSKLEDNADAPSGILRVSTTNSLAAMWIAPHIKRFMEEYPEINLAVLADDREVDIALREADVALRPMIYNASDLVQHYVMSWHVGLYASAEYLEKFGTPQSISDLDHHRLLTLGEENVVPYKQINWMLAVGKGFTEDLREPYLRINSAPALIECTLSGMGISSLSEELPLIRQGKLIRVLPELKGPTVDIFFISPKFLEHSKRVSLFRDYFTNKVPAMLEARQNKYSIH